MTAKEYLSQIRKLDHLINIKQEEINKLRLTVTTPKGIRYDVERVSGGKPTTSSEIIAKIVDYEAELTRDIDSLIELKREALKTIEALEDGIHIKLLYLRYFDFKKWEEISIELNCSYRWVIKLHGKALQELDRILQK